MNLAMTSRAQSIFFLLAEKEDSKESSNLPVPQTEEVKGALSEKSIKDDGTVLYIILIIKNGFKTGFIHQIFCGHRRNFNMMVFGKTH